MLDSYGVLPPSSNTGEKVTRPLIIQEGPDLVRFELRTYLDREQGSKPTASNTRRLPVKLTDLTVRLTFFPVERVRAKSQART